MRPPFVLLTRQESNLAIIWGLSAALSYGIADFISREASHREGSLRTLLYIYLVGIPAAALFAFTSETILWETIFSTTGLWAALLSLEFMVAGFLLYRALAAGPLLIVAPLSSSFAVVTVALSLLSGERPTPLQVTGIVMTIIGVILAATAPGDEAQEAQSISDKRRVFGLPLGVALAIGAAIGIGVGNWLIRFIVPTLGGGTTVFVMRVMGLIYLVIFFLTSRTGLQLRSLTSLRWLLPIGVLDTAANWFYNLGLLAGLTSIVAVMTSLYAVVTVLLGYFVLKERITRMQQIGILITLAGVALVSI